MYDSWILIVEDSIMQAKKLYDILFENNFKAKIAYSGDEALRVIKEDKPGIVISDIVMPGMDGYELCSIIKKDDKYKDISVILLTSLNNPKDIVRGLESGADNFLVKPYEESNLLSRIRYILINDELRKYGATQVGIEVFFSGQKFYLNPGRVQIIDVLLSTYEDAVIKNLELVKTRDKLEQLNAALEGQVKERTVALEAEIAERKVAEERIKHLAYNDFLTKLPNRVIFNEMLSNSLAHAKRRGHKLALIFLDLDNFKIINDTVGHIQGDKMLLEAANRLLECVRDEDIVARMSGDEFSIILPQIDSTEDVARVAERILERIQEPWQTEGYVFYNTASIGIAVYAGEDIDEANLLKDADTAMYRAKEKGKNKYEFYSCSMNQKIMERMDLDSSLRNALSNDEFVIYYQPIVNTKTKAIEGTEALLRWQHPEKGRVSPMDFIAISEETGVIVPIGEWVLRKACAQNKAWQMEGLPAINIAVNISARQFRQPDLVEIVAKVLQEKDLDPKYLILEITEATAMRDPEFTDKIIQELQALNVQVAMDNFGTGISSMNWLRHFKINILKIDASSVRGISASPDGKEIVSSIINLSKSLDIRLVAEGVETQEQSDYLLEKDCEQLQGFLFSKPLPPEEIHEILTSKTG